MNNTLREILFRHDVVNKELVTELSDIFSKAMRASREWGKKCSQLTPHEEELAFDQFAQFMKEYVESEASIFAVANLDEFTRKYGLYKKKTN